MTTATWLGGGSVGSFMPTSLAAMAAAEAAVALPIVDIEGRITGAISASASISIQPPSLDLAAAIEGALQLPGVAVDVTAMASLASLLNVELGVLQAALALILAVRAPLSTVGIHAYKLEGEIGGMGGALGSELGGGVPDGSGPTQIGTAVVLVAADNGAAAALEALFAM
jgi:hypothetical protein